MGQSRGCLIKLVSWAVFAVVFVWGVLVALHPWALHIGGRSTPLLYWHGTGTVFAKGGKALPLYVSFFPGRPQGVAGGGRWEGKTVSSRLQGVGRLCIAPGRVQRLRLIGTMYGGYMSDSESLLEFRLLEWRWPFAINSPTRGYFDVAGMWRGPELVMSRPNEQGRRFNSGLFIDHAIVTLRWASYGDFEAACHGA
ncbi:MAG TPA: hypothetical protein VLV86_06300 [Vicinamibacterales bacterium]|nr:hypothetical protein [Vicinamibacterales bacterium]